MLLTYTLDIEEDTRYGVKQKSGKILYTTEADHEQLVQCHGLANVYEVLQSQFKLYFTFETIPDVITDKLNVKLDDFIVYNYNDKITLVSKFLYMTQADYRTFKLDEQDCTHQIILTNGILLSDVNQNYNHIVSRAYKTPSCVGDSYIISLKNAYDILEYNNINKYNFDSLQGNCFIVYHICPFCNEKCKSITTINGLRVLYSCDKCVEKIQLVISRKIYDKLSDKLVKFCDMSAINKEQYVRNAINNVEQPDCCIPDALSKDIDTVKRKLCNNTDKYCIDIHSTSYYVAKYVFEQINLYMS